MKIPSTIFPPVDIPFESSCREVSLGAGVVVGNGVVVAFCVVDVVEYVVD